VDGSLQQFLLAVGSGSLLGCTLGLIGGGWSILTTPLLMCVVGMRDAHTATGTGAIDEAFSYEGWRFEVVDLDGRRIDKLLVQRGNWR
jgi:Hemolysins and related proteins containing CBS domains